MENFSKKNLKYNYKWTVQKNSIENLENLNNGVLNKTEGQEVLNFINKYMQETGLVYLASFHKIERAIKVRMPSAITKHTNIKEWLIHNL